MARYKNNNNMEQLKSNVKQIFKLYKDITDRFINIIKNEEDGCLKLKTKLQTQYTTEYGSETVTIDSVTVDKFGDIVYMGKFGDIVSTMDSNEFGGCELTDKDLSIEFILYIIENL